MKKSSIMSSWQIVAMECLLYLMVSFVPLYVSNHDLFPFTTPKSLFLILGSSIFLILWLYQLILKSEVRIRFGVLHIILFIFLLTNIVSAILGFDPKLSFFGSLLDGFGINLLIALSVFAMGVSYMIKEDPLFLRRLLLVTYATSVIVAIGSFFITAYPLAAGGSTLGNTSYTGGYLLINLCFAIYFLCTEKRLLYRILMGLGACIILFSPIFFNWGVFKNKLSFLNAIHHPLQFAGSAEGALLGFLAALLVMAALFMTRSKNKYVTYLGTCFFVLILVASFQTGRALFNPHTTLNKIYVEQKTNNRFLFVDIAREGFLERPIMGWGANNYGYIFIKDFSSQFFDKNYAYEPLTNNPHNIFWEYLVSGGIVGLCLYLSFLATIVIVLYSNSFSEEGDKRTRILPIVLIGAATGYIIQALFIFETAIPLLMFFLIVGIALSYSNKWSFDVPVKLKNIKKIIGILLIVIVLPIILYAYILPRKESVVWASYTKAENILKTDKNPQYISAIGYSENTAFVANSVFNIISRSFSNMTENDRKVYQAVVSKLESQLREDVNHDQNNFYGLWALGKLYTLSTVLSDYKDSSAQAESLQYLDSAMKINSNDQNLYFDIAQAYLLEKDYNDALRYTRGGIAIAPEYLPGYKIAEKIFNVIPEDNDNYIKSMQEKWISE